MYYNFFCVIHICYKWRHHNGKCLTPLTAFNVRVVCPNFQTVFHFQNKQKKTYFACYAAECAVTSYLTKVAILLTQCISFYTYLNRNHIQPGQWLLKFLQGLLHGVSRPLIVIVLICVWHWPLGIWTCDLPQTPSAFNSTKWSAPSRQRLQQLPGVEICIR